jgi:hypothetical protein
LDENLAAPVNAGQRVGWADYFNDGVLIAQVPVVSANAVSPKSAFLSLPGTLLYRILGLLLVCALLVLFVRIRIRARIRRRMRRSGARLTAMPYMPIERRRRGRSRWI